MRSRLYIFAALLLAAIAFIAAAPGVQKKLTPAPKSKALPEGWSTPIDLSPKFQFWSYDGRVATDPTGTKVAAVWVEEGGGGKRIGFNTNETGSWETAKFANAYYMIGEYPAPEVAFDMKGDIVITHQARMGSGNYEILFRKRSGGNWADHENVSRTPFGGSMSSSFLIYPETNDYFLPYQDDAERPSEDAVCWNIFLERKPRGIDAWTGGGQIPDPTNRSYFPDGVADDKGRGYIVYDNRADMGISHVFFSENKTLLDKLAWTAPFDVSGNTGTADNWGFAYPRVTCDNNGNVYVSWLQNIGNWEAFFRKRVNGVWVGRENISNSPGQSARSTVAVSRKTGEIYMAWGESTTKGWSVLMKTWTRINNVWQWSEAVDMTPDSQTADYPSLFADANGGIHLVYTSNKSGVYHIWYTGKLGEIAGHPPINVTTSSKATSADPRRKDTTVSWEANPENQPITLLNYKIYRKKKGDPDSNYTSAGTVEATALQFKDANLLGVQQYTYKMTSIARGNLESQGSTPVDDQLVLPPFFPPTNVAVTSALGDGIYKKNNTLTWQKNAQNRASEVAKYRIYRKGVTQDDKDYVLAGEVGPGVFSYKDVGLVNDQKYTYVAAAYSIYSHESERSGSITDIKVYATTYPPVSPAVTSQLDAVAGTKINSVTWQDNPQNQGLPIESYRIYRKPVGGTSYALAGTVGVDSHRFDDDGLSTGVKYYYKLASVPEWKIESGRTSALAEHRVFPPINIALQTVVNSYLMYQEKANKLTWVKSALNDPVTVSSYKIYRRKSSEADTSFAVLGTVSGSTYEYLDRKLSVTENYVYRITAVDSQGHESATSAHFGES
jgi:fibronectin type 3 domain-containing protein